ncbi:MAG: hypothetical protein JSR77_14240 [Planctomycetes bacterium]|nr:hypothetical protein [Planctomycetota bacterium]
MTSRISVLSCIALGLLTSSAAAQALSGRSSTLNFNYVYGAGGDTHSGNDSRSRSSLLATDFDDMHFSGSTSGVLPGDHPYYGGVLVDLHHTYEIMGSPAEMESISASASTQVVAGVSGAGSAVMHAVNPGNEITLSFTVQSPVAFRLHGSIALPGASPFSYVALQRFNGFNWEYVFYSAFLPNGQGPFDLSGTLVPSEYRISGVLSISAGANENYTAGYNYALEVPGIGTCIADYNVDGGVDGSDVDAFFADWESGNAAADVNSDGGVDGADVSVFFAHWEAGC